VKAKTHESEVDRREEDKDEGKKEVNDERRKEREESKMTIFFLFFSLRGWCRCGGCLRKRGAFFFFF